MMDDMANLDIENALYGEVFPVGHTGTSQRVLIHAAEQNDIGLSLQDKLI